MAESNFIFLRKLWPDIYTSAKQAEHYASTDPIACLTYARQTLEKMLEWMYTYDEELERPYDNSLHALLSEPSFQNCINSALLNDLRFIQKNANTAVHRGKATEEISKAAVYYLFRFLSYNFKVYSEKPSEIIAFNDTLIPKRGEVKKSKEALLKIQSEFEAQQEALRKEQEQRLRIEEEVLQLRAELARVAQAKAATPEIVPEPSIYSEAQTRKLFIDTLLIEAGWDPNGVNVAEYPVIGMPGVHGKGAVDYVLWGSNGLPLAVVEAKKTSVDARTGQHQARLYADCLEKMHGLRPVIFYTNGFSTHIWDDTFYHPRLVSGIYTQDELQSLIHRRETRKPLSSVPINKDIVGRDYQEEAIRRVTENFEKKSRAALMVMATGSGKTRTAAALVDVLTKAGWIKRALFLADRIALVRQAMSAFAEHAPHLSAINLSEEKEDATTRLVFSTYPTMMNMIDAVHEKQRLFSPGHFDLIIVDEAHRSVYEKYKAIFDYFDAMRVGLTATPKEEGDRDTYALFGCEPQVPTFDYTLDQAVHDGFLVPPKGEIVDLGFIKRGIRYSDLPPEEQRIYESTFRDESGQGLLFDEVRSSAINKWLFNADTIEKVLDHLFVHGIKVAGGDRLGKTIIFAKNHEHAVKIEEIFNKHYPHLEPGFARVIDNYDRYAQDGIDKFKLKDSPPHIAISVDMMDTGIDVWEVVNLVFFKPVYSSAKYWQMIGRGTRLCPDLFGPGDDKTHFVIFDFCGNFEFFGQKPHGISTTQPRSLSQQIFETKLSLEKSLREKAADNPRLESFRKELLDELQGEIQRLFERRDNFRIRRELGTVQKYKGRGIWDRLGETDRIDIVDKLAPLIELDDADEAAKRFDVLMYQLEREMLEEQDTGPYARRLLYKVDQLDKIHVPAVDACRTDIRAVQDEEFFRHADVPQIEKVRQTLRGLMRLIRPEEVKRYDTDFADRVERVAEHNLMESAPERVNYRKKVEKFIRDNHNHLVIHKLRTNQPISGLELEALERMIFDGSERGTKEDFEKQFPEKLKLGVFIRSIVGLDRNAAKLAFAEFLSEGNLRADQIRFIDTIIDHFRLNGILEPAILAEQPFTYIHDAGIFGVFEMEKDQAKIVSIVEGVNRNAEVG